MGSHATDVFLAAARLRISDRDPDRPAVEAFIEYLDSIINGDWAGTRVQTLDGVRDLLLTLRIGIGIIETYRGHDVDLEARLTDEVGLHLAESLHNFYEQVRADAADPKTVPGVLGRLIDALVDYVDAVAGN